MAHMRTPLTPEQVGDLQACMYEWERIRRENGFDKPFTSVDVVKSCLLGRMTIQGKPPLPAPPPTAYSAPWYEVVERNGADLQGNVFMEVEGPFGNPLGMEGRFVSICQCLWEIKEETEDGYILRHDRLEGLWTLRHRTDADPSVKGGGRLEPDGTYTPYYLGPRDWILVGPSDG